MRKFKENPDKEQGLEGIKSVVLGDIDKALDALLDARNQVKAASSIELLKQATKEFDSIYKPKKLEIGGTNEVREL